MSVEQTLSIIKPDGVKQGVIGDILNRFEKAGLTIKAMKMVHLSVKDAEGFYAVHSERPFFGGLTEFIASGPVVITVLEGEGAISNHRKLMGATNPADAAEDTLRKRFATSLGENAVHGSDAPETAAYEINHFFNYMELH